MYVYLKDRSKVRCTSLKHQNNKRNSTKSQNRRIDSKYSVPIVAHSGRGGNPKRGGRMQSSQSKFELSSGGIGGRFPRDLT